MAEDVWYVESPPGNCEKHLFMDVRTPEMAAILVRLSLMARPEDRVSVGRTADRAHWRIKELEQMNAEYSYANSVAAEPLVRERDAKIAVLKKRIADLEERGRLH